MVLRQLCGALALAILVSACAATGPHGSTRTGGHDHAEVSVQAATPPGGLPPGPLASAAGDVPPCGAAFYSQDRREADLSHPYPARVYWTEAGPCRRDPRQEIRP